MPLGVVCKFREKSGIRNMDDWSSAKKEVFISAIGSGTSTSDIPKLLGATLGLPTKVIDGYRGGAKARLAVESGEVDGYSGSWQTVKGDLARTLRVRTDSSRPPEYVEPHPDLKHTPLAIDYAKTPEARKLIEFADYAPSRPVPIFHPAGHFTRTPRGAGKRLL